MADDISVKVALRIRPLVQHEVNQGAKNVLEVYPDLNQVRIKDSDKAFTYNYAFGSDTSQHDFYSKCIQHLIDNLFKGYNVTIFAYGQTGSGKTHSMGTAYSGEQDMGVIPRAVNEIFNFVKDNFAYDFTISVTFMELYQEVLYDLLSDKHRDQAIVEIREDNSKGIVIPNLTEKTVNSAFETLEYLRKGSQGRSVASTNMNAQSSRSHAIFTVNICMQKKGDSNVSKTAKFNLVDLAGSERSKKTGATGQTFKEGVNINKGLFVLGKVMSALGEDKSDKFISYRESNLTRLLKDSLGGNSITLMIACVSPADNNLEETLSTLRYADRARKIKNKPIVNEDPKAAEINALKKLVAQMRLELAGQGGSTICQAEFELMKKENGDLKEKNKDLVVKLSTILNEKTALFERLFLYQSSDENLQEKVKNLQEKYESVYKNIIECVEQDNFEILKDKVDDLKEIQNMFDDVLKEMKKSEQDLRSHERDNTVLSSNSSARFSGTGEADLMEQHENHNTKQYDLNNQLQEVIKGLAVKEHLVQEIVQNAAYMVDIKDKAETESKIALLEKERDDLIKQLKSATSKGSSNSSAEHSHQAKRVQDLEIQIQDLKRKVSELERLKKMKDRDELKIKQLHNEILQMKQMKVKLMKNIKQETDNFRMYRIQKERDLQKLKDQGRKQETQIMRMQNMHTRQQNVLRRKVEEAAAINKRLKDALALRKEVQQSKVKTDKIGAWIKQEMDIYVSIIDAKTALSNLLEDRGTLTEQLEQLKNSPYPDESIISDLQNDIDIRNVQISNLQQKLLDLADDDKSAKKWDNIQTMAEAKFGLNTLFNFVADMRKEQYLLEQKQHELENARAETANEVKELKERLQNTISMYDDKISALERENEEKISILLRRETASDSQTKQYESIKMSRIEALERENEQYQEDIRKLKEQLNEKCEEIESMKTNNTTTEENINDITHIIPKVEIKVEVKEEEEPTTPKFLAPIAKKLMAVYTKELPESPFEQPDDPSRDPDWTKTPLAKRVGRAKPEKSFSVTEKPIKRTSEGGCNCKSNCSLKYCGCKKFNRECSSSCKCNPEVCINRDTSRNDEESADNIIDNSDSEDLPLKKPRIPLIVVDENAKRAKRTRKLYKNAD